MTQPVFRFAPSPNGRLHLGHAYSALLNEKMAHDAGGRLLLRIEDTDQTRCAPEFIQHIYDDLAWLGLRWEIPVRVQSEHLDDYAANIETLWALQAIYPCFCSRKTAATLASLDPDGQAHYAGSCRSIESATAQDRITKGEKPSWRIDMARVGTVAAAVWGDVVIAKPIFGSSYHIAVVTDDHLQGVTHVVRGRDMESATPIHTLLQSLLGFSTPIYHHHDLIQDERGQKLSKSLKSTALATLRDEGVTAGEVRKRLGF
jgi:glutamyl-Q tRNA(Asp) synthetase